MAYIYKKVGISVVNNRNPEMTFPGHLEHLTTDGNSPWKDVTCVYDRFIDTARKGRYQKKTKSNPTTKFGTYYISGEEEFQRYTIMVEADSVFKKFIAIAK